MFKKEDAIFFVLLIILILPVVFAVITVNYDFKDKLTGVSLSNIDYNFYRCDGSCDNSLNLNSIIETNSGGESSIQVGYPSEASYVYYSYKIDQTKCYYPTQSKASISSGYEGLTKSIEFEKKSVCQTNIPSVSITGEQKVGQTLTITTAIDSPFKKGTAAPSNFVPPSRQDYYKADTKIDLLIDGKINQTVTKSMLIDTREDIEFSWKLSQADIGNHKIKIVTNVNDCQCSQPQNSQTSSESSVTITGTTTPACTSECSTLNEKKCYNDQILQTCTSGTCNYWANTTCQTNYFCNTTLKQCSQIQTTQTPITQPNATTCLENWRCNDWSACVNGLQTRNCIDASACGTTLSVPPMRQGCSEENINQNTNTQTAGVDNTGLTGTNKIDSLKLEIGSVIIEGLSDYKYTLLIALGIIILIIGLVMYNSEKKPVVLTRLDELAGSAKESVKEIFKKEETKGIKPTDLLLGIIDSLADDEQDVCNKLMEMEGIRQLDLKSKLGMTKERIEIILKKLERRQVIKERDGPNPRIFFNDWLK